MVRRSRMLDSVERPVHVVPPELRTDGGRAQPPHWAIVAAHVAAWTTAPSGLWRVALAIGLPVAVLWWWSDGDGHLSGTAHALVGLTYLPLALWGPLLGAVAWSYHHRRAPLSDSHSGRGSRQQTEG